MKKIFLPILAGATLFGIVGCGGQSVDSTKTLINIENFGGGVGSAWLDNALQGFEDLHAEDSYEEGKVGVKIKYSNNKAIDTSSMKGSGKHIYFTEANGFPHDLAGNGSLLNINDVVTGSAFGETKTIESKIDEDFRPMLQYRGEYYALPHYEWYPGLTFDRDLFESKKLYFAAPEETKSTTFKSFDVDYKFVLTTTAKRSCGNDGIYGTDDDGLPTSLPEFIALCKYMQKQNVSPILFPGNHQDYSDYLLEGMLASLTGKAGIRTFSEFTGEVEIVTGYTSDKNYIVKGSGIATPITEKVTLTEATGYKTRMTVERYALISLLKILEDQQCFDRDLTAGSFNNENIQKFFLEGSRSGGSSKDYGMICEGNYWANEASGRIAEFYRNHPEVTDRKFEWMSLPTNLFESVTEGNGSVNALMDTGNSFCLVNKTVEKKPGVMAAVKDFLRYIYSDNELSNFTKTTGVGKAAIQYDFSSDEVTANLNAFQKSVLNLKKTCGVVYAGSDNPTYLNKRDDFIFSINSPIWQPGSYKSIIEALRSKSMDAKDCFEATQISEVDWNKTYYIPSNA